ncbi:MAG: amino acid-binding protein, partial [Proteobacteria bacterium]|nr:amino acid-binding protein [Pseudomonadota bacterium]
TFDSHVTDEPHAGGQLFHMEVLLRLPPGRRAAEVQAALEDISAEIMVDVSLEPAGG